MRLCSNSHWLEHSPPLFKKFNTLTIHDIHKLTLGSFMYNFVSNNLPDIFTDYFIKNSSIHSYQTRISQIYRPYNFKYDLARNTIRRQGPMLWNSIIEEFRNAKSVILPLPVTIYLLYFKCNMHQLYTYLCCYLYLILPYTLPSVK